MNPASIISSMPGGSGALAAYVTTGSDPMTTATSTRPWLSRRCAAPSLWICQCIIAVRRSTFWIRYMPQLRDPLRGSWLNTSGNVMNGPPSSGQHVRIGS